MILKKIPKDSTKTCHSEKGKFSIQNPHSPTNQPRLAPMTCFRNHWLAHVHCKIQNMQLFLNHTDTPLFEMGPIPLGH